MDEKETKRLVEKYHLLPSCSKIKAYGLFEQGLRPDDIVRRELLSQLRSITIHSYYSEWKRRHSRNDFETEERARLVE